MEAPLLAVCKLIRLEAFKDFYSKRIWHATEIARTHPLGLQPTMDKDIARRVNHMGPQKVALIRNLQFMAPRSCPNTGHADFFYGLYILMWNLIKFFEDIHRQYPAASRALQQHASRVMLPVVDECGQLVEESSPIALSFSEFEELKVVEDDNGWFLASQDPRKSSSHALITLCGRLSTRYSQRDFSVERRKLSMVEATL